MYANSDTNLAGREFVYSTTTANTYSRFMTVMTQSVWGLYCAVTWGFAAPTYSTYAATNMNVDILNFGMSSTAILDITIRINTLTVFSMVKSGQNSYPWFRVYVEGYDYTCTGINKMLLTYIDSAGNRNTYNALGWAATRCAPNFFEVDFYNSGVNINGGIWNGLANFDLNEFIEIEAQFSTTST